MNFIRLVSTTLVALALAPALWAQVPQIIAYQGRIATGASNFDGAGQFKFALVSSDGTTTFWSNDGTSSAGSQPTGAVGVGVNQGLFSVLLGEASLTNMQPIGAAVFTNSDVRLRIWFGASATNIQLLTPDQRLTAVGYALMAANVPDGVLTGNKLAAGAVSSQNIAKGAITSVQLASNSVTGAAAITSESKEWRARTASST
jgi:hypothetical protein